MGKPSISLGMIVRNEERALAAALESAAPFVSEMIVVDTGSTDNTIEVARAAGANVFQMEWPDSFSIARNRAIKLSTGDWCLYLDADERIPSETGEAMLRYAGDATDEIGVFMFPEQNFKNGLPWKRFYHPNLFRNHKGFGFVYRVHEQLRYPGYRSQVCLELIDHLHHDSTLEGVERKTSQYGDLLKLDLQDFPNHPGVLVHAARHALLNEKHYVEAEKYSKRCIAIFEKNSQAHELCKDAYLTYSMALIRQGNLGKGYEAAMRGLHLYPHYLDLLFLKGEILAQTGEIEGAKAVFLECLRRGDEHEYPLDTNMAFVGHEAMHNIGAMCASLGDHASALEWFKKALTIAPTFEPSKLAEEELLSSRGKV